MSTDIKNDTREEIQTVELSDLKAFSFLLNYAKGYKKILFFGIFLLFISTLLTIFASYLLSIIIDKGIMQGNTKLALTYAGFVVGLEAVSVLIVFIGRKILAYASSHTILQIRQKMFEHIKLLPMSYYDKTPQGRIVTRLTHDVEGLDEFFSSSLGRFGTSFMLAIVAWGAILFTNLHLGLIVSVAIIPTFIITFVSRNRIRKLNWEMSKKNSTINAQLSEFIQGLNVIRAFGMEKATEKTFDTKVEDHLVSSKAMNMFYTIVRPITSLFVQLPLLVIIFYGGGLVLAGTVTLGLIVTYVRYIERFTSPIEVISREIHVLQQAFTSADRVAQFLLTTTEDKIFTTTNQQDQRALQGKIEFKNLGMYYSEGRPILNNISFTIQPGESIGFLGRTGSGKTTTLSLISRLYPYQSGEIKLDDLPIENWTLNDLRAQIGFVSQDVFLFRGSLRDNLSMGRKLSDEKILSAARSTGLSTFIDTKRDGLDFEIYEQGDNLSVGERQLVSITRTLLQDPKILILDEATSNIDPKMEEILQTAMKELSHGRTTIIIAHRLHTLRDCDRLFVFKDGQILAEGNHEALIKNSAYYRELYGFSQN
jgi:ATP-binding cassette subfamily B multidrug efflux pump